MKHLSLVLFFSWSLSAQTMEWYNPKPTGAELRDIKYITPSLIYASGDAGTFIKSTDGGVTWQATANTAGLLSTIGGLSFLNKDTGWICTSNGKILKTTNGGASFSVQLDSASIAFYDIIAVSPTTIMACGDTGYIYRTTNGGSSWTRVSTNYPALYALTFVNADSGYVCGNNGYVYRTTDGGASWTFLNLGGTTKSLRGIHAKGDTVLVSGNSGGIFVSTNAGITFTPLTAPESGGAFYSIVYAGNSTVYTGSNLGKVYRSTNLGTEWTVLPSRTNSTNWLFACDALNPTTAVIAGRAGTLLATQAGKDSLLQNPSFTGETFRAIQRIEGTIFAAGLGGITYRSSDNGATWKPLALPSGVQTMSCLKFTSPLNGVIAGASGKINYTTDGGDTWTGLTYSTSRFWGLDMKGNLGFTVNSVGAIYRTTNGGQSWSLAASLGNLYLYGVSIIDTLTAFLCTGQQAFQVYKTTDGGNSWNVSLTTTITSLYAIDFSDKNKGTVVGDKGVIYTTTDGGVSWVLRQQDMTFGFRAIKSFSGTLIAAGVGGLMVQSDNDGVTWRQINNATGAVLYSVDLWSSTGGPVRALVTGESGNLFTVTLQTGTAAETVEKRIPENFSLAQNYPNPFNPATTIAFTLDAHRFVSLAVYDLLGREISRLVYGELPAGSYQKQWDASPFPSGIYFYRLEAGGHAVVKKAVFVK